MNTKPARNDPCPCGSGQKYKRCHGIDGAEQIHVVFHLDPDAEHGAVMRLVGQPPMSVGQVADSTLEAFLDPWEDPYGLGIPAEALVTPVGVDRLEQMRRENNTPEDYVRVLMPTGNAMLAVRMTAVTRIEAERWRWPSPDPRSNADLN